MTNRSPWNTDEFQQLQTFAESFSSKQNSATIPKYQDIYAHHPDEYSLWLFGPRPSSEQFTLLFHPELTRPRDVLYIMINDLAAPSSVIIKKPGYIGVPLESNPNRINFPEKIMQKLGLARHHRELYTLL